MISQFAIVNVQYITKTIPYSFSYICVNINTNINTILCRIINIYDQSFFNSFINIFIYFQHFLSSFSNKLDIRPDISQILETGKKYVKKKCYILLYTWIE